MFQDIRRNVQRLQFIGGHFGLADLQRVIQLEQQLTEPRAIGFLSFTIMRTNLHWWESQNNLRRAVFLLKRKGIISFRNVTITLAGEEDEVL